MQKAEDAKIKSARRVSKRTLVTAALGLLAVVVLVLPYVLLTPATARLRAGDQTYTLVIAATSSAQSRGLGGREKLPHNEGMLFVFDKPAAQCFWMKDMQFPIDIIWLDSAKTVTYIAPQVSPESYPQEYCGDGTTKYVIELNAGEAKRADIKTGSVLDL